MKHATLAPFALLVATLMTPLTGSAAGPAPDQLEALTAPERHQVIATLTSKLQAKYVFPDVAISVVASLKAHETHGDYDMDVDIKAFARHLASDLSTAGNDHHLQVFFAPQMVVDEGDPEAPPTPDALEQMRTETRQQAGGVFAVERLRGNVGYLDLRSFAAIDFVSPYYNAAMSLLSGTDAMIIDLRRNGGGDAAAVAYLMSFFFAAGDERHLNDLYFREGNKTREYWTTGAVPERYTKPVYVLMSPLTFSGAEECAYDFQTQKRAVLIGETSGGGANPGDVTALGHGLVAFIPNGRAINPVTHTNWEHVGVKPDIEVKAADARQRAYVEILQQHLAKETDPEKHEALSKLLDQAQKGEQDQFDYSRRP